MSDSIKSTDPRFDVTRQGLVGPMRRDLANDFASGNGYELAKANLRQLVGTQRASARGPGEVAWDGNIGSEAKLSVHRNGSRALDAVTSHRIQEAARRELPNLTITSIKISRRQNVSYVAIHFVPTDGYGAPIGEEQSLDVPLPES